MDNNQILMARQPIFDQKQRVVAYELLYRSECSPESAARRGSSATGEMIINAFTSIFDDGAVKQVPAFINLTYDMVVQGTIPDLPKKQIVLELLEDAEVDDAFIEGVKKLASQGYRIALDDFIFDDKYIPLLEIAQIVKVDVLDYTSETLASVVAQLKPYKVALLAEKVETHEKLAECQELGFKLFQGYFLSKPKAVKGKKVSANQVALLQLMQELQKPDVKPETLEEMIIRDPALTFKLLRIVNSAGFSLVRHVESIAEAIVLLGIPQVKKWVTLIAMSGHSDKPEELSRNLLIRGRMSEQVAEAMNKPNAPSYFMAGVMSGLHALLDLEQEQMLKEVPLGDDIKDAVRDGLGDIGHVLNDVIHYESGDWDLLSEDFDGEIHDEAYREAIDWSKEAMQAMSEAA